MIVGSGLAAIEIAFALRKRWEKRSLGIVCNKKKIHRCILKSLYMSNIKIYERLTFDYGKILLCTGNSSPNWIQKNILKLDPTGRIITNQNLKLKNFSEIFATGDCAVVDSKKRPASGIFAVKVLNTLATNIKKDIERKSLKCWNPQRLGLQIVKSFPKTQPQAFAIMVI